jgi:nitroimidazol reductase NimA-like FMN-containing flavoprotein (pyridoxamine 5'-phosphate oxidase superfamily)
MTDFYRCREESAVSTSQPTSQNSPAQPQSERVRLRRKRERGSYDRVVIDAILDEALIAHLGIVDEHGQPFVIPTLHAREGDVVYCHGSTASRTLRALAGGAPACLTVTLIDGLVLARSAMHHSANYRSAMLVGQAKLVEGVDEKRAALRAVVEHIVPGRWADVRAPSANELRATAVLALPIAECSAKVRSGGPLDDEEDYALGAWAGVIPLTSEPQAPEPDQRLRPGIEPPSYVSAYSRPASP